MSTASINYYDKFSIMLIGDEGVGKTSLIERYINNNFSNEQRRTIGVDSYIKEKQIGDKNILIKLWDTVGNEKQSKIKMQFSIAQCICIISSINNRDSFEGIEAWYNKIKENCTLENTIISMLFNKVDLIEERTVTEEEIIKLSEKLGIHYYEASAKTGEGVETFFDNIIKEIYEASYGKRKKEDIDEGSCNSEIGCQLI